MQSLYSVIYDFFANFVFTAGDAPNVSFTIGGGTLSMADWLNHTATIVVLVVLAIVAAKAIAWLFSCVSHAFGWLK